MIQGEGFIIDESKFDFFFGRVSSTPTNTRRSQDNLEGLRRLGIDEATGGRERLMQIFQDGLNSPQIDLIPNPFGVTIVRKVEIAYQYEEAAIEIGYFYSRGDLTSIPKISTLIIKFYR